MQIQKNNFGSTALPINNYLLLEQMDMAKICLCPATQSCIMYKNRSRLGNIEEARASPLEAHLGIH
jgi:hypothetical protein